MPSVSSTRRIWGHRPTRLGQAWAKLPVQVESGSFNSPVISSSSCHICRRSRLLRDIGISYSPFFLLRVHRMFRSRVMFGIVLAALTGLQAMASGTSDPARGARIIQSFDQDWTFQYFPQQAPDKHWAEPAADDTKWPAIALPHTWSVYETTRDVHPFIEHATERE